MVVWAATIIAQVLVITAFSARRILPEFRVFAAYLVVDVFRSLLLLWFGRSAYSAAYRVVWVATEPFLLALQALIVLEFYRLLYRAYPGIEAFARVLIAVAAGVALIVTFGTLQIDLHRVVWKIPDVQRLFVVKRLVSSLLGVILVSTMLFFPRAPSARNVLLHGWLLTLLFLAAAGGFFGINFGAATQWMGALFLTVQLGSYIAWALGLRSRVPRRVRPSAEAVERTERFNQELLLLARWLV